MSHATVHPIEPGNSDNGQATEHHRPEKTEAPSTMAHSTEAEKPWARLLYDPPKSSDAGYVMEDFLPPEDIPSSYSTQWYRFRLNGKHYAIRPQHPARNTHGALWGEVSPPEESHLDLEGVAIIGYLHPGGIPSLPDGRHQLREKAVSAVSSAGYEPVDIVALHRDSRWLEPMLLIPGIPTEEAGPIATTLHQPLHTTLGRRLHRTSQPDGASAIRG